MIRTGDCLDIFGALDAGMLDAVITDLPAGISFMGRKVWDGDRGGRASWVAYWAERLAAARDATKPGGWLLCWALPRTCGWTQCAIEDAGWAVTDTIHHTMSQGWPKNRGQLKPSHELWFLARNGASNGLQIDAARVPRGTRQWRRNVASSNDGRLTTTLGSWPANTVLSHADECESDRCLARCGSCSMETLMVRGAEAGPCECGEPMLWLCPVGEVDMQSGADGRAVAASMYFNALPGDVLRCQARASKGERDAGCDALYWRANPRNPFGFDRIAREEWEALQGREFEGCTPGEGHDKYRKYKESQRARGNVHPTVKPIALMEHFCRLLVPPGGTVGDICTGSGGTAIAADRLGLRFVGAELCPEAVEIASARRAWWKSHATTPHGLTGEADVIVPGHKSPPVSRKATRKRQVDIQPSLLADLCPDTTG